jgi:hypothetical protein
MRLRSLSTDNPTAASAPYLPRDVVAWNLLQPVSLLGLTYTALNAAPSLSSSLLPPLQ